MGAHSEGRNDLQVQGQPGTVTGFRDSEVTVQARNLVVSWYLFTHAMQETLLVPYDCE